MTCCSSAVTPRVDVAVRAPIEERTTATTAIATSTSMMVKPAVAPARSDRAARHNFDASGQPIHPNFVNGAQPGQHDRAAARHPGRKKADGGGCRTVVATDRQGGA